MWPFLAELDMSLYGLLQKENKIAIFTDNSLLKLSQLYSSWKTFRFCGDFIETVSSTCE